MNTATQPRPGWWHHWYPWIAGTTITAAAATALATTGHPDPARILLVTASTAIGASSAIPSIAAMRRDPHQLSPITWTVWAVMAAVATWASASTRDWPAAIFALVGVATCTTIATVAILHGTRRIGALDITCLLLALAGIALWQTLDQPGLAVIAVCVADFIGLIPTLHHAWRQPEEEPASAFVLIGLAALVTATAAWGQWTVTALAYPLYVAASTATVAALASRTRPHSTGAPRSAPHTTTASTTTPPPALDTDQTTPAGAGTHQSAA